MLEALIIDITEDTPGINFNPAEDVFVISERSLPENAIEFYQPIFAWFEKYMQNPNEKTNFEFKLEYFNTASAKQIAKLLLLLEKLAENNNVVVKWFYSADDSDMLSSGQRYSKLIKVDFEFIEF